MKVSSLIGLFVGLAGLYLGATLEGSNPMAVLNLPAMLIVLGGTLGATIMGTSFDAVKAIPLLARTAGLLAHLAEEQESPVGFLMAGAAEDAITYEP